MPSPEFDEIKDAIEKGKSIKATYTGGSGFPVYQMVPVLIGTSPPPGGGSGPDEERVLCYKYSGAGTGWRCFKVAELTNIGDATKPPPSVPPVDPDRQNCVETIVAGPPP